MSGISTIWSKISQGVGALLVCAIVLVVPVFSLVEIGHFFNINSDKREATPLASISIRQADKTQLPPQLFNEPLISVTFDDGYETTYTVAMPLLQKYGIKTTQYLLSGTADDKLYVSWDQMAEMQKAGHEIACHSHNHPDLTSLDDEDLNFQLNACKQELSGRFGPIYNFASPYGAETPQTLNTIYKYFSTQRNTDGDPTNGVNEADVNTREDFNPKDIIGVTVRSDTTVKQLQELVAYTKAVNGWLVLTYHQADDAGSKFSVDEKDFEKQFKYLSGTNVRIVTVQDAMRSVEATNVEF